MVVDHSYARIGNARDFSSARNEERRTAASGVLIVTQRKPDLFQITLALLPMSGLATPLPRQESQCVQDCNDCDDDQSFNEDQSASRSFHRWGRFNVVEDSGGLLFAFIANLKSKLPESAGRSH